MKLVLWLGGPEVRELEDFPGYFDCPRISMEDLMTLIHTIEEMPRDAQIIIPLEAEGEEET